MNRSLSKMPRNEDNRERESFVVDGVVERKGVKGCLGISAGRGLKCSDGAGVMTAIKMTLNKFGPGQKGFLKIGYFFPSKAFH